MRNHMVFAAGLAVGVAAVVAILLALPGGTEPAPPTHGDTGAAPASAALHEQAAAFADGEVAALARQLRQLEDKVEALGQRLANPPEQPARSAVAATSAIDERALAASLAQAEQLVAEQRFARLGTSQLRSKASIDAENRGDFDAAALKLKVLLARELPANEREQALVTLEEVLRAGGRMDEAILVQRELIDRAGIATETGRHAAFRLVWTLRQSPARGDKVRARELAQQYAAMPAAPDEFRRRCRHEAALAAHELGDDAIFRAEAASLLRELGDSPADRSLRSLLEQRLAGK